MSRLKLLWWFAIDLFHTPHPDMALMSAERVNREVRSQAMGYVDEATAKCIARVKRRMLLGTLCPDPPVVSRKRE